MNWVDQMLTLYEREIVIILSVLLIAFNVANLYFIVDLFSYDEIIGYLTNGEIKSDSPRTMAYLLFGNGIFNLLFVMVSLMSRLFFE